jgi:multidrug efflux system membrane fusion protein
MAPEIISTRKRGGSAGGEAPALFCAICAIALVALAGCSRGGSADAASKSGAAPAILARKYPVTVMTARPERLTYRMEAIGGLEAEEWVQVAAQVEGALGPLRFQEGDRVDPSKVLVEVDLDRHRLALARAEAIMARAEAELRDMAGSLARRRELRASQPGSVTDEEIGHQEALVARAEAALAEAKAARDLASLDFERARVRAPIAGVIERREATAGQYVKPGAIVAAIVRTKPIRLRFTLREDEAAKVSIGTSVKFTVPAYPEEVFEAEIFHIARSADPKTRRVEVLARNPNEDERLKPGYFARALIEVGSRADAILLPETSVRATEEGFVAFVVENGKARRRSLEIGLESREGRIEVTRGIAPGDRVIVRGAGNVADGVEVQILSDEDGRAAAEKTLGGAGGELATPGEKTAERAE